MPKFRPILISATAILLVAGAAVWLGMPSAKQPATAKSPAAPVRPPEFPLHSVVAKIVREGPETPYLKLNYIIKEIPVDLADHDVAALISFITAPRPQTFSEGEWGSLTNDIQEALSVQTAPNEKVARALIATFRDDTRTQLMRDYALQHIGGFAIYLVHTRDTRANTLPPFFADLTGELIAATENPSKPWAGTALNLLDGLLRAAEYRSFEVPGITAERLTDLALPIAANQNAPLNARLPALQLASRRGSAAAPQLARRILAEPSPSLMLAQSAAAVLAAQGNPADLALLESLRSQNQPHLQTALTEAIRKISAR